MKTSGVVPHVSAVDSVLGTTATVLHTAPDMHYTPPPVVQFCDALLVARFQKKMGVPWMKTWSVVPDVSAVDPVVDTTPWTLSLKP